MTVIIAVGCAGGRMVTKILSAGRIEAEYLAVNTQMWQMVTLCTQQILCSRHKSKRV
jgi:cell division GTPase FtsZ